MGLNGTVIDIRLLAQQALHLSLFLFFLKQPQDKDGRASSLFGRQYQKRCEGVRRWDGESREVSTGCVGDPRITTVGKYGSDL